MRIASIVLVLTVAFGSGCRQSSTSPAEPSSAAVGPSTSPEAKAPEATQSGNDTPASPVGTPPPAQVGALANALFAGGCFWGMEELLREIDGVVDTEVGYAGGTTASPSYEDVKKGTTGHAESVLVTFDPKKLSYEDLLAKWFFRMHDPTTDDRQGNDVGTQYRSVIFPLSPAQRATAEKVRAAVDASGRWDEPVVTTIETVGAFTPAEGYHQDYLQKNPGGYTCHYLRDWGPI